MNLLDYVIFNTPRNNYKNVFWGGILIIGATATASPAHALNFRPGNGIDIDWDTSISYNAQWRMAGRDSNIIDPSINPSPAQAMLTNDGDENFDKHDMTRNRFSFVTEADINKEDYGVFLRARGWYDAAYDGNDLTLKPFQRDGVDYHKSEIELMDAFAYGQFYLGERGLSLRAGEQVVSWGESLFAFGGISSAQGPIDITKANAPGTELKDIFLPIGQVYVEAELTDSSSLGAYYQYDWEPSRIDAPGTYFNVLESIGEGSTGDLLDIGVPVTKDEPSKGQWGVTFRYLAESLNSTEFGLYYLEYNDFMPSVQFLPPFLGPQWTDEYFEDINLIGASFGTVIGNTNVSGEISYRDGQPVQLSIPGAFYYSSAKTLQAQVSALHIFGANSFADNLTFSGEVGYNRVLSIDSDATAKAAGVNVDNTSAALDNDRGAAGFTARLKADYFQVYPGVDMAVSGTYRNDFSGVSAIPFTYTEGRQELGLNLDFVKQGGHSMGAAYVVYLTDTDHIISKNGKLELGHLSADRDYVSLYYKYRF